MPRPNWTDDVRNDDIDTFDTSARRAQGNARPNAGGRKHRKDGRPYRYDGGLRPMARGGSQGSLSRELDRREQPKLQSRSVPSPAQLSPQDVGRKKTTTSPLVRRLRALAVAVFLSGYLGLVAFLVWWLLSERRAIEGIGRDSPECQKMICPLESACTLDPDSGLARCASTTTENLQTVELILGIVVGVPSAVCLPCTAQWLIRIGCPSFGQWLADNAPWNKSNLPPDYSETNQEMDLETFGAMLGKAHLANEQAAVEKTDVAKSSPAGKAAKEDNGGKPGKQSRDGKAGKDGKKKPSPHSSGKEDDGLSELFTPVARKQAEKQAAEEELDALFAPKATAASESDEGEEAGGLSDFMATRPTKAPPKPPSEENLESEFSALFHRPARAINARKRALPTVPTSAPALPDGSLRAVGRGAAADIRSEISEGLSVLFTATKRGRARGAHRNQGVSQVAPSLAPPSASAISEGDEYADQDVEEDDFVDDELGDPPDFFAYAVRLAKSKDGQSHLDDGSGFNPPVKSERNEDAASDASAADSLENLEENELSELFHPPLGLRPL